MLNNYWWFKLLTDRFKVVEGVTPEDMINECNKKTGADRYMYNLSIFSTYSACCVSHYNGQSEQRKISQGANGNSTWNEVKLSIGKCYWLSPDYFKFWIGLDESSRERGKSSGPISQQMSIQRWAEMRIKKNISERIISWSNTKFFNRKNCPS